MCHFVTKDVQVPFFYIQHIFSTFAGVVYLIREQRNSSFE